MRWGLLGLLCSVVALASCGEAKLTQDEAGLLDAMAFLVAAAENGKEWSKDGPRWQREVTGRAVSFSVVTRKHLFFGDKEYSEKTEDSAHRRYIHRMELVEPCVVRWHQTTDFSKGASREDFSHFRLTDAKITLHPKNAHRFVFIYEPEIYHWVVRMDGPGVACGADNNCADT